MFLDFIISLIAVIAFAVFEYTHNKTAYSIKTAWVKYVAALALGTFGFSYLLKWPVFQDVLLACFVVAFLFFFWVIVQKLKIKGVPGQPLKVLPVLFVAGMMASCSPNYHNQISGKPFPAQQARQQPLDDLTKDSIVKGWVDTTLIHVENGPNGPVNVYSINDLIVTVKKTAYQDWKDFWSTTWRVVLWFAGLIIAVGGFVKFITVENSGGSKSGSSDASPMAWVGAAFIGVAMIAMATYPWSNEMDVPKAIYDTNQMVDKDQHSLDWSHPKSY